MNIKDRIMAKIAVDPLTGCWIWTGHLVNGYGKVRVGNRKRKGRECRPCRRLHQAGVA